LIKTEGLIRVDRLIAAPKLMLVWPMNELAVVRIKRSKTPCGWKKLFMAEVGIETGWEGTIVANADSSAPMVEFTEYSETPFLVNLDAANLELVGSQNE
jgi:hypothetical protein